jgi:hypothetical protein
MRGATTEEPPMIMDSSRPGWDLRVYGGGPEDAVDVSCIAICVNFDY